MVRGAAVATLRLRGARVSCEVWQRREPDPPSLWAREDGLVDLKACRSDTSLILGPATFNLFVPAVRALDERHPWLLRDEERSALAELKRGFAEPRHGLPVMSRQVHIGSATFKKLPVGTEFFYRDGDPTSRRRDKRDPLWILEALVCTDVAHPLDEGEEDGQVCRRFSFDVDLQQHRHELNGVIGRGWRRPPHVVGEAWIDAEQRIRRVTWHEAVPRRTRSRNLGRDAKGWKTIVLWDFGTPVDIRLPALKELGGHPVKELVGLARAIWRRKREYER